ncbi:MAG: winged helix-turn-helix domain-containing protein [Xenococcaceae cyanobacterium]
MSIQIIKAKPGPSTTELIRNLILAHPDGITVKQIGKILNRPVSMIQRCIKPLTTSRQIYSKKSVDGMQIVYYLKREQGTGNRD